MPEQYLSGIPAELRQEIIGHTFESVATPDGIILYSSLSQVSHAFRDEILKAKNIWLPSADFVVKLNATTPPSHLRELEDRFRQIAESSKPARQWDGFKKVKIDLYCDSKTGTTFPDPPLDSPIRVAEGGYELHMLRQCIGTLQCLPLSVTHIDLDITMPSKNATFSGFSNAYVTPSSDTGCGTYTLDATQAYNESEQIVSKNSHISFLPFIRFRRSSIVTGSVNFSLGLSKNLAGFMISLVVERLHRNIVGMPQDFDPYIGLSGYVSASEYNKVHKMVQTARARFLSYPDIHITRRGGGNDAINDIFLYHIISVFENAMDNVKCISEDGK